MLEGVLEEQQPSAVITADSLHKQSDDQIGSYFTIITPLI